MTTTEVPGKYPVGLNNRGYFVDTESGDWRHVTIPQIRPQADTGDETGSQSLNPEGFWIRFQDSFDYGAGQDYFDKADSNRARFRASLGVDPWTRGELKLLKATTQRKTAAGSGYLLTVGGYLYFYDRTANALYYTTDVSVASPTWTAVTGLSANAGAAIATDGYTVYIAQGTSGIYTTTRGAATAASWVTGTVNFVAYVKGRVMAAADNLLYNVTTAGALPSPLMTHSNTDLDWWNFAEGTNNIYIAGYTATRGFIYRTQVKADGTALDVPVVAGELPDGELIVGLYGYLGFIFIGTSRGVRFATANADGDLTIGALIPTGSESDISKACYAFEGQGQYVWFGWPNYDASHTGLGRLNLANFSDAASLVPAYATDLMALSTQGVVTSIATFKGYTVFAVLASGVWANHATNYVDIGAFFAGRCTFGVADQKVPRYFDIRRRLYGVGAGPGSVQAWLWNTSMAADQVGTYTATSSAPLTVSSTVRNNVLGLADWLEPELDLVPVTGNLVSPVVNRWTLKTEVIAPTGTYVYLPLLLHEQDNPGYDETRDLNDEVSTLKALRTARTVVDYQEGATTYSVTVEDLEWRPHSLGTLGYSQGVLLAKLKIA